MPSDPIVIALIAALPGLAASWFAYRKSVTASAQASRHEATKVEAEAYKRARQSLESVIGQLEEQVAGLRRQVSEEQDLSARLRNRIFELEQTVSQLRSQLIRDGMDLGPMEPPESARKGK